MRKILCNIILIFLVCNLAYQPAYCDILRPVSLIESTRNNPDDFMPQRADMRSAGELWTELFVLPDERFSSEMGELYNQCDGAVYRSMRAAGLIDRFKQKYEAGDIASGKEVIEKTSDMEQKRYNIKYMNKFGAMRDINPEIRALQTDLGIGETTVISLLLIKLDSTPLSEIDLTEAFQNDIIKFLQDNGVDASIIGTINWDALIKNFRAIKPWLKFWISLMAYEQDFITRYQKDNLVLDIDTISLLYRKMGLTGVLDPGKNKEFTDTACTSGVNKNMFSSMFRRDYEQFLREAFWTMLFNCKLNGNYFASDEAYNDFILLLFDEKYNRGEINEFYFGDTPEEIATTRKRIITGVQQQLNAWYGVNNGNVLPDNILSLIGRQHPLVHWETDRNGYATHIYDPFFHALRAVRGSVSYRAQNRKCLRLALFVHDISKGWLAIDKLSRHAEESSENVRSTLENWGLSPYLSEEEKTLITLLVLTHADLFSVRPMVKTKDPYEAARRIKVPDRLAAFIDRAGLATLVRRMHYGDLSAIPGVATKGIPAGALNKETLAKNIEENLVKRNLQPGHALVIGAMLEDEYADESPWSWMEPHRRWLRTKSPTQRKKIFFEAGRHLADVTVQNIDGFLDQIEQNRENFDIPEEEDADVQAFIMDAFYKFVEYREKLLPATDLARAVQKHNIAPFDDSLREAIDNYAIADSDMEFFMNLESDVRIIIENVLSEMIPQPRHRHSNVVPIGSTNRGTFVSQRLDSGEMNCDFDFDFNVWLINMPDTPNPFQSIGRLIIQRLVQSERFRRFFIEYKNWPASNLYSIKVETLSFQDAKHRGLVRTPIHRLLRIKYKEIDLVNLVISKNPATAASARQYNKMFEQRLNSIRPEGRDFYLKTVRLLKDFIRNPQYLDIHPWLTPVEKGKEKERGCLWSGQVVEQLVSRSGGTFSSAMQFIYDHSFDERGFIKRSKDFPDIKRLLAIPDPADPSRNLMADLGYEEWQRLAFASRRFLLFQRRGGYFSLPNLAGKHTTLSVPRPLPHTPPRLENTALSSV